MTFGGATFSFILFGLGCMLSLHAKRGLLDETAALISLKFIAVVGFSKAPNRSVFFSAGKQLAAVTTYSSGDHSEDEVKLLTSGAVFLRKMI
jgi:hypothetical protein